MTDGFVFVCYFDLFTREFDLFVRVWNVSCKCFDIVCEQLVLIYDLGSFVPF